MKYKIIDKRTGNVVSDNISSTNLTETINYYLNDGVDVKLAEDASAGSISAGDVAVTATPLGVSNAFTDFGTLKRLISFDNKKQKRKNKKSKKNNNKMKNEVFSLKITESFDLESVFSRLSGIERRGTKYDERNTVTYGIEDDNGNLMKVTIKKEDAEEFENEIRNYISDIKTELKYNLNKKDNTKDLFIGELLYKLKDKFDIVDVEFPTIPKDVIYDYPKASYNKKSENDLETEDNIGHDDFDSSDEGVDDLDFDKNEEDFLDGENEEEMNSDDFDDQEESEEEFSNIEDMTTDGVGEPSSSVNDEESFLSKIIDMLKAQAESEIEKAKAEAEKAKAEQARYTAQATQFALKDKEEQLKYELEVEEQKKREKEAKKLEDMAKMKLLNTIKTEDKLKESANIDDLLNSLNKEKMAIEKRWAINHDDAPDLKQYKNQQKAEALKAWNSKYKMALNKKAFFEKNKNDVAKKQSQQNQNNNQSDNQDNNPDKDFDEMVGF